jgi:CRP-like cAMP-binding protein
LSFLTGTPRGTEAVTTEDTRLLLVPRGRFFEVIEDEPDLWEPLAQRLKSRELLDFLDESPIARKPAGADRDDSLVDELVSGKFDRQQRQEKQEDGKNESFQDIRRSLGLE